MIRIENATAESFALVEPLLATLNNPAITRAQWRSLFDPPWPCPAGQRGLLLLDDDRLAGFIGTIWSERTHGGVRRPICNLSTWVVAPEHRTHSLRLLQSVLERHDCTFTCYAPAPAAAFFYRRFGFRELETAVVVLPVWPGLAAGNPWGKWRVRRRGFEALLSEEDRAIWHAHRGLACGHLLVHSGDACCYVIHARTRGRRASFAHVHYISHPAVFAEALPQVRRGLFLATGTPLVMIDRRLTTGLRLPGCREAALRVPHVFRSDQLPAEAIDNLYSETLLLGLG